MSLIKGNTFPDKHSILMASLALCATVGRSHKVKKVRPWAPAYKVPLPGVLIHCQRSTRPQGKQRLVESGKTQSHSLLRRYQG
ncbi:unnamed protein product [Chondrus crispus]|uniref:Uncharacterized protein n=1 Tax=Chondrus crispus TaxID=2769 RepID=R7QHJ5_CHOCR|nr:unnamed protein product [Chondrus crispus]CDF36941.1 unnamed protein product [Chondrus crispus]|eukprot:XP_005716760.1 unnamed protein product [Chondrus crispus]